MQEEAELPPEYPIVVDPSFVYSLAVLRAEERAAQQEIWKFRGNDDPQSRQLEIEIKWKMRELEAKIDVVSKSLTSGALSQENYLQFLEKLLPQISLMDQEIVAQEVKTLKASLKASKSGGATPTHTLPRYNVAQFNQPIDAGMWKVRLEDGSLRTHQFTEKTFRSPTYCVFCTTMNFLDKRDRTSFIAGVYKQGLQCQVCKYTVHKHCLQDCEEETLCGGEPAKEGKLDPQEMATLRRKPIVQRFTPVRTTLLQLYSYALESKDLTPVAEFLSCGDLKFVPVDLITNRRQLNGMLLAAEAGFLPLAELLLSHSANVNATNGDGLSPLLQAAWSGHENLVKFFLERGANILQRTRKGSTALTLAIESGHCAVVRQLVQAGAPLNTLDEQTPYTPLMVSIMSSQTAVTRVLLELKADIELRTSGGTYDGFSAIFFASLTGEEPIVQTLLKLKADPNSRTRDGFTPLIVASQKGRTSCVVTLSRSAELEHATSSGDTALMWAVYHRQWEVVGALVSLGANITDNKKQNDATRVSIMMRRDREFKDAVATAHIYRSIPVLSLVLLVCGYRGIINDLIEDRDTKTQTFQRFFVFKSR